MAKKGKVEILNKKIADFTTLLWSCKTGSTVDCVSVSSDGSYIAAGDWDTVYFFNREGELLWSYKTGGGVSVSIDAKGAYVAVGSGEDEYVPKENENKVYFFDRSGELLWTYDTGDDVSEVSVPSDGSYVAATAGKNLYLFDRDGTLLWSYKKKGWLGGINQVKISSDGSYIAAGDSGSKVLFFNRDGELLWSKKPEVKGRIRSLDGISISSNGSYIAAVSGGWSLPDNKGNISFFDDEGELLWERDQENFSFNSVAVSSDGFFVAAGGDPLSLITKEEELLWFYEGNAKVYGGGVAISYDGSYVAACPDGKVSFFNRKGELLWSYKVGRADEQPGQDISMSSDGTYLAAIGGRNLCFFKFDVEKIKAAEEEKEPSSIKPDTSPGYFISKCPSCDAPFKGKSGDACEYCGSIIRTGGK